MKHQLGGLFFLFARFIHALDDLDALIAHADEIIENNLQTLNMQMLNDLFSLRWQTKAGRAPFNKTAGRALRRGHFKTP